MFQRRKKYLGGAANVFYNINLMGINCDLCGCIADDTNGKVVDEMIYKISQSNLIYKYNETTTTKTRYMESSGEEFIRVDNEKNSIISDEQYRYIEKQIANRIKQYRIVVFSDYNKGFLNNTFVKRIIKLCRIHGVVVIVDTKKKELELYKGCDVLKVNKKDLLGNDMCNIIDRKERNIAKFVKDLGVKSLIMTNGNDKITYIDRNLKQYSFMPKSVVAKDTTGAGDVFTCSLAVKIYEQKDIFSAIDYARNICANTIQTIGTSVIQGEIKIKKLVDKDTICIVLKKYRESGKSIVFVNGCFDIIHAGHIELLKQAKMRGDILIVGINSDKSIKRIKGSQRPVFNEHQRCMILSSIEYIDHIIIFDESSPNDLIEIIKPDVVLKGEEYCRRDFPEKNLILKLNGKIDYCKNIFDLSTTSIIEKIQTNNE